MLQSWMMRLYSARETIGLCAAMALGLLMASSGFLGWPSQETMFVVLVAFCLIGFGLDPSDRSLGLLVLVVVGITLLIR